MKNQSLRNFFLLLLPVSSFLAHAHAQVQTHAFPQMETIPYVVTASDYADFLDSVAAESDPNHLYNDAMSTDPEVTCIARVGAPGRWHYEVIAGKENYPIHYVNRLQAGISCADRLQVSSSATSTSNFNAHIKEVSSLQQDEPDRFLTCDKDLFEIETPSVTLTLAIAPISQSTSLPTLEEVGGVVGLLGLVALCPELITLQDFREAAVTHLPEQRLIVSGEGENARIQPENSVGNRSERNRSENLEVAERLIATLESKYPGVNVKEIVDTALPKTGAIIKLRPDLTSAKLNEILTAADRTRDERIAAEQAAAAQPKPTRGNDNKAMDRRPWLESCEIFKNQFNSLVTKNIGNLGESMKSATGLVESLVRPYFSTSRQQADDIMNKVQSAEQKYVVIEGLISEFVSKERKPSEELLPGDLEKHYATAEELYDQAWEAHQKYELCLQKIRCEEIYLLLFRKLLEKEIKRLNEPGGGMRESLLFKKCDEIIAAIQKEIGNPSVSGDSLEAIVDKAISNTLGSAACGVTSSIELPNLSLKVGAAALFYAIKHIYQKFNEIPKNALEEAIEEKIEELNRLRKISAELLDKALALGNAAEKENTLATGNESYRNYKEIVKKGDLLATMDAAKAIKPPPYHDVNQWKEWAERLACSSQNKESLPASTIARMSATESDRIPNFISDSWHRRIDDSEALIETFLKRGEDDRKNWEEAQKVQDAFKEAIEEFYKSENNFNNAKKEYEALDKNGRKAALGCLQGVEDVFSKAKTNLEKQNQIVETNELIVAAQNENKKLISLVAKELNLTQDEDEEGKWISLAKENDRLIGESKDRAKAKNERWIYRAEKRAEADREAWKTVFPEGSFEDAWTKAMDLCAAASSDWRAQSNNIKEAFMKASQFAHNAEMESKDALETVEDALFQTPEKDKERRVALASHIDKAQKTIAKWNQKATQAKRNADDAKNPKAAQVKKLFHEINDEWEALIKVAESYAENPNSSDFWDFYRSNMMASYKYSSSLFSKHSALVTAASDHSFFKKLSIATHKSYTARYNAFRTAETWGVHSGPGSHTVYAKRTVDAANQVEAAVKKLADTIWHDDAKRIEETAMMVAKFAQKAEEEFSKK
ncbi:MAG: hypothetical protein ACH346_04540 [Chthoniobacterales bacterium]